MMKRRKEPFQSKKISVSDNKMNNLYNLKIWMRTEHQDSQNYSNKL